MVVPKIEVLEMVKLINHKIRNAQALKVNLQKDSVLYYKTQGYINGLNELKRDIKNEFHNYFSSEDFQ